MEIHPPHASVHSLRDFLIHIAMITIGVLIALSAEGVREVLHNRHMASDAEENIRREIGGNRRELEKIMQGLPDAEKQQRVNASAISGLLRDRKSEVHELKVGAQLASLRSAAWSTAAATGALG